MTENPSLFDLDGDPSAKTFFRFPMTFSAPSTETRTDKALRVSPTKVSFESRIPSNTKGRMTSLMLKQNRLWGLKIISLRYFSLYSNECFTQLYASALKLSLKHNFPKSGRYSTKAVVPRKGDLSKGPYQRSPLKSTGH